MTNKQTKLWVMGGEGGVKWPRSKVDHMLLSSAEFKSTWTYASLSPISLYVVVLY